MRHALMALALLSSVLWLAACGAHIDARGYSNAIGYRIAAGDEAAPPGHLLSADWRVERRPKVDLFLHHVRDNGVLWVQTIRLPEHLDGTEPRALMQSFAQSIAGGHWWFDFDETTPWTRPWTVTVLDQAEAAVAGQPGHLALLHIAQQSTWNTGTPHDSRATVVLLRPNLYTRQAIGEGGVPRPVVMIVGYANAPADFDRSLPDFERLLESLVFGASGATQADDESPSPGQDS